MGEPAHSHSAGADFCEDMPKLSIDAEQMKRIVVNLVDNAITAVENKVGYHVC